MLCRKMPLHVVVEGERDDQLVGFGRPVGQVDVVGLGPSVVQCRERALLPGPGGDGLGRPLVPGLRIELLLALHLLLLLLLPLCPFAIEAVDRRVRFRFAPLCLLACLVASEEKLLVAGSLEGLVRQIRQAGIFYFATHALHLSSISSSSISTSPFRLFSCAFGRAIA